MKFNKSKFYKFFPIALLSICIFSYFTFNFYKKDISKYNKYETEIHNIYPELSKQKITENSGTIVKAKFNNYTDPFKIKPANGGDSSIFRDAIFTVEKSYKGNLQKKDKVNVRIQGGDLIDHENKAIYSVNLDDDLNFDENSNYLLFLNKQEKGGHYNTKGDYYYIFGNSQGVINLSNSSRTLEDDSNLDSEINALIDNSKEPVSEDEEMKNNLEKGLITQEEYDSWLKSRDDYAEIIN